MLDFHLAPEQLELQQKAREFALTEIHVFKKESFKFSMLSST